MKPPGLPPDLPPAAAPHRSPRWWSALSPAARWRWHVAARAVTAIAGGYALTALASSTLAVLAVALGVPRVDAALAAMLASFAVYCGAIVWSCGAATLARAWAWLASVTTLLWVVRAIALALG